jgi:hypothetical protein
MEKEEDTEGLNKCRRKRDRERLRRWRKKKELRKD